MTTQSTLKKIIKKAIKLARPEFNKKLRKKSDTCSTALQLFCNKLSKLTGFSCYPIDNHGWGSLQHAILLIGIYKVPVKIPLNIKIIKANDKQYYIESVGIYPIESSHLEQSIDVIADEYYKKYRDFLEVATNHIEDNAKAIGICINNISDLLVGREKQVNIQYLEGRTTSNLEAYIELYNYWLRKRQRLEDFWADGNIMNFSIEPNRSILILQHTLNKFNHHF